MRHTITVHGVNKLGVAVLAATLSGCTVRADSGPGYYEPPPVYYSRPAQIPPGHLPPPGECRIWYPDRPPGHQPPPGDCYSLQYQVPPGAFLVRG